MLRPVFVTVLILFIFGCSLIVDEEQPEIFYEFEDFDILPLGRNVSDLLVARDDHHLYLTDYTRNSLVKVSISGQEMALEAELEIGSHPIAMDMNSGGDKIAVVFNGESNLKVVDLPSFTVIESFPVTATNVQDVVCLTDEKAYISSSSEPTAYSVSLVDGLEAEEAIHTGELLGSTNGKMLYVASSVSIHKYDVSGEYSRLTAFAEPFQFSASINHFIQATDESLLFVGFTNRENRQHVKDVWIYRAEDLSLEGKFEVRSPGLGVALSPDGRSIFVAPTEADETGVFVVEFDLASKLPQHYYLVAGNLKKRGILMSPSGDYFYVLVDTPGDADSFEPYRDKSFDLQRVEIHVRQ